MQLFYAPDITLPLYQLPEDESRHATRVLRMKAGDELHLTDGRGNLYTAVVENADPKRCLVRVVDTVPEFEKRGYSITIACAPTKNPDRFEWFAEKATETGVDRITPIICEHSERRIINTQRLERVVVSAAKQSLKAYMPIIDSATSFKDAISSAPETAKRFIAHCRADYGPLPYLGTLIEPKQQTFIMIGPEGDFSKEEIDRALAAGFEAVSLGGARLRTETAALTAVMTAAFVNNMHDDDK